MSTAILQAGGIEFEMIAGRRVERRHFNRACNRHRTVANPGQDRRRRSQTVCGPVTLQRTID
jgi:hypothetical protein